MRRRVLGCDLGFAAFGWAVLELGEDAGLDRVVGMGVITTEPSPKKLNLRQSDDQRLGADQNELGRLGVAGGRLGLGDVDDRHLAGHRATVAVALRDIPILQCTPQASKRICTGSAAATKLAVENALLERYGHGSLEPLVAAVRKTLREHPFDALASIVACLDSDPVRMARRFSAPEVHL